MSFRAEIKAHSIDERGNELLTVSVTFPRIILAEINTHRMLSKNTSSSRAIPFNKMIEAIEKNPFIPIAWQKSHKGMQGSEYITDEVHLKDITNIHLEACNEAIKRSKLLTANEVTKQIANRYLEPFMWTTMLITSPVKGGWDNFFNLRCPQYEYNVPTVDNNYVVNGSMTLTAKSRKEVLKSVDLNDPIYQAEYVKYENFTDLDWLKINKGQGEIHIMKIAEMIYDELQASTPVLKMAGDWHIPYFNNYKNSYYPIHSDRDLTPEDITVKNLVKISTSMAARESYTVVGENKEVTFDEHLKLYDRLVSYEPPHSSPMEHCAEAMPELEYGMFTKTFYKFDEDIEGFTKVTEEGWCRNFRGFIPLRHKIEENK